MVVGVAEGWCLRRRASLASRSACRGDLGAPSAVRAIPRELGTRVILSAAAKASPRLVLTSLAAECREHRLRVGIVLLHVVGDVLVRRAADAVCLCLLVAVELPLAPVPVRDRHTRKLGREAAERVLVLHQELAMPRQEARRAVRVRVVHGILMDLDELGVDAGVVELLHRLDVEIAFALCQKVPILALTLGVAAMRTVLRLRSVRVWSVRVWSVRVWSVRVWRVRFHALSILRTFTGL